MTLERIKRRVTEYTLHKRAELNIQRKEQLQALVREFDEEQVALASGLSLATLRQYLRATNPSIGHEPVAQAVWVLTQVN